MDVDEVIVVDEVDEKIKVNKEIEIDVGRCTQGVYQILNNKFPEFYLTFS